MKVLLLFSVILLADCQNSLSAKLNQEVDIGKNNITFGRALREEFLLNRNFVQLNHGAFGTYPKSVQADLYKCQARAEGNADLWIRRDARKEMVYIRSQLAELINADSEDIVVVPNTTNGINAVLRSLVFTAGDRIVHFSSIYNSMLKIIQYLEDSTEGFEAFLDTTSNIRLALIDHISSSPAMIIPIERLIPILKSRGILVLIDGAHAVGQIPIDLKSLAPDFYITNAHKWLFTARGTAILYVDKKYQGLIHPATIASPYTNPASFQEEFFYVGTIDYCPYMTVTSALEFRRKLGGESAIIEYTHRLAKEGGALVATVFGTRILQEDDQLGNMVEVQFPLNNPDDDRLNGDFWNNFQLERTNIYVGISKQNGQFWGRFSAQVYTDLSDFQLAADILNEICTSLNDGTFWENSTMVWNKHFE